MLIIGPAVGFGLLPLTGYHAPGCQATQREMPLLSIWHA